MVNKLFRILHHGKSGFTLIEILVVAAILGILAAIIIPNIMSLMSEGEDEAKNTEHHNMQIAVLAMMVKAEAQVLDSTHEDVDTIDEVQGVTATNTATSTTHYLNDYLYRGEYPLMQPYDIALDGTVTVD